MKENLVMKNILITALLVTACGGGLSDPLASNGDPRCESTELGKLTSAYSLELTAACKDFDDLEACPQDKRANVDKKYEQLFKEWAECE